MPPHITRAAREATAAVTEAALRADADLAPVHQVSVEALQ